MITDHVFARRFDLAKKGAGSPVMGAGAIAGVAIGAAAAVIIFSTLLFFFIQRRRAKRARKEPQTSSINPPGEMVLPSPISATAELASPLSAQVPPDTGRNPWPSPKSPPAYEGGVTPLRHKPPQVAQELPGSTFIHQHHPAYARTTSSESSNSRVPTPPRTPTRSLPPHAISTSPDDRSTSPHTRSNSPPPAVSPLGSPKQPMK